MMFPIEENFLYPFLLKVMYIWEFSYSAKGSNIFELLFFSEGFKEWIFSQINTLTKSSRPLIYFVLYVRIRGVTNIYIYIYFKKAPNYIISTFLTDDEALRHIYYTTDCGVTVWRSALLTRWNHRLSQKNEKFNMIITRTYYLSNQLRFLLLKDEHSDMFKAIMLLSP